MIKTMEYPMIYLDPHEIWSNHPTNLIKSSSRIALKRTCPKQMPNNCKPGNMMKYEADIIELTSWLHTFRESFCWGCYVHHIVSPR